MHEIRTCHRKRKINIKERQREKERKIKDKRRKAEKTNCQQHGYLITWIYNQSFLASEVK